VASAKLPFFQFYPSDWLSDPLLRACSIAARGLWIDLLSLMWDSPRRGFLMTGAQKPYSAEQLARMAGCAAKDVSALLDELKSVGVCSVKRDGTIYSRRIVREEEKRAKERIRKAEERATQRAHREAPADCKENMTSTYCNGVEKENKQAKYLLNHEKCPEPVRHVSGVFPGDISEVRSQSSEESGERISELPKEAPPPLIKTAAKDPPPAFRAQHGGGLRKAVAAPPAHYRPDALRCVRQMLIDWHGAGRLPEPDDALCAQLLDLLGGDTDANLSTLANWLRGLRRRGKDESAIQSWGWFVTVLAADAKAHATGPTRNGGAA